MSFCKTEKTRRTGPGTARGVHYRGDCRCDRGDCRCDRWIPGWSGGAQHGPLGREAVLQGSSTGSSTLIPRYTELVHGSLADHGGVPRVDLNVLGAGTQGSSVELGFTKGIIDVPDQRVTVLEVMHGREGPLGSAPSSTRVILP